MLSVEFNFLPFIQSQPTPHTVHPHQISSFFLELVAQRLPWLVLTGKDDLSRDYSLINPSSVYWFGSTKGTGSSNTSQYHSYPTYR